MIEVVIALILVTGVLLIFASRDSVNVESISMKVYEQEALILREIQLNNSLRILILEADISSNWEDSQTAMPTRVTNQITRRTPNNLVCEARICFINQTCEYKELELGNIYAQSVAITSAEDIYSPRQLKIFCLVK